MTEEKFYSLLELEENKIYEANKYLYKLSDGVLMASKNGFDCDYLQVDNFKNINEKVFKEVKQKKKITLYRLTVNNNGYRSSVWDSDVDFLKKWASGALIVKTETKEIEVDE